MDQSLLDKQKQLEDLIAKMMTPEMKKLMEELQKMMDQADKNQVRRLAKSVPQAEHQTILVLIEILEAVHAAAGEKGFVRAAGVAPFHRLVQKGLQPKSALGAHRLGGLLDGDE